MVDPCKLDLFRLAYLFRTRDELSELTYNKK